MATKKLKKSAVRWPLTEVTGSSFFDAASDFFFGMAAGARQCRRLERMCMSLDDASCGGAKALVCRDSAESTESKSWRIATVFMARAARPNDLIRARTLRMRHAL